MRFLIINGANINLLGIREPEIYGTATYDDLVSMLERHAAEVGVKLDFVVSNHEGDLVDAVARAYFEQYDGIVINAGGYTHTSIAVLDALKSVPVPAVEVHITDITQRESFRHVSYIAGGCIHTITGHGMNGYCEAVDYLIEHLNHNKKPC